MPNATAKRSIIDAKLDPGVWGGRGDPETQHAWHACHKAIFGLPMTEVELEIFRRCTGRTTPPTEQVRECWLCIGRRGGKSINAAEIGVFVGAFRDWRNVLARGERGVVMCLAADRRQAGVLHNYARSLIAETPMLARMLRRETAGTLELSNGINLEVHTSSYKAVRGRTVVCAICDEAAFWRDESSANPDVEVIRALKPAMATAPKSLLLCVSSPYSRKGALWQAYQKHYGKDDNRVLFWKAPSLVMNPTLPQDFLDDAFADDPVSAESEYNAEFRNDIASYIDAELIDSLTRTSPAEIPKLANMTYSAFCDPSGGRGDNFTLAIGHRDKERLIIDVVRSTTPPFDPFEITESYAALLAEYGITFVTGDAYGAEWVSKAFTRAGVRYETSALNKSAIYLEVLPHFTRGIVELPPDAKLRGELVNLERRTSRTGRDTVDHGPRGHDDLANAVCGCLWSLAGRKDRVLRAGASIFG